jgi:hypothetical protein
VVDIDYRRCVSSPVELLPAHLEWQQRRDAISAIYARFYAPIAIAVTVLAFVPLFREEITLDGDVVITASGDSLLDLAGDTAGPAAFALILMATLVALLFAATFRAREAWLPLCIAALALVLLGMLLDRPGFGSARPALSAAGIAGLMIAGWTVLLGVVHAVHLHPLGSPADAPADEADGFDDGVDDEFVHDDVSESDRLR